MRGETEVDEIRELYDYTWWANERIISGASLLTDAELTQVVGGSFATLWSILRHMAATDPMWLRRWQGKPVGPPPDGWPGRSLRSLVGEWKAIAQEQAGLLNTLSTEDLRRPVRCSATGRAVFDLSLERTILHVVNDATYHRGQAVAILCRLGGSPPPTDLCLFYAERMGAA